MEVKLFAVNDMLFQTRKFQRLAISVQRFRVHQFFVTVVESNVAVVELSYDVHLQSIGRRLCLP